MCNLSLQSLCVAFNGEHFDAENAGDELLKQKVCSSYLFVKTVWWVQMTKELHRVVRANLAKNISSRVAHWKHKQLFNNKTYLFTTLSSVTDKPVLDVLYSIWIFWPQIISLHQHCSRDYKFNNKNKSYCKTFYISLLF